MPSPTLRLELPASVNTFHSSLSLQGVTIDELLTQKKPEVVVEYKKTNVAKFIIPIIILSILSFILLIALIPEPKIIGIDNVQDYYDINPREVINVDDKEVTIKGSVNRLEEVSGYELVLSFTILYSYYDNEGSICEILYIDRKIVITDETSEFIIELVPKTEISDFKEFCSLDINYKIVEVKSV